MHETRLLPCVTSNRKENAHVTEWSSVNYLRQIDSVSIWLAVIVTDRAIQLVIKELSQ